MSISTSCISHYSCVTNQQVALSVLYPGGSAWRQLQLFSVLPQTLIFGKGESCATVVYSSLHLLFYTLLVNWYQGDDSTKPNEITER